MKESIFSLQKGGVELFRICGFGGHFCFNSKPSFSCESWRQWITFPVASKYSCKRKRVGLESKLHPGTVLTYNFATAITETTTLKLQTLATELHLVSSFQNCELKQEASTLTTELQQTLKFRGHEKTRTLHTVNRATTNLRIPRLRKNKKQAHLQPSYNKLTNSTIVKESIFSLQKGGVGIVQNLWLRGTLLF